MGPWACGVVVVWLAACASDAAPPPAPLPAPPPSAAAMTMAPASLQLFTKHQLDEALPELARLLSMVPGTPLAPLGPLPIENRHDAYVAIASWCVGDGRLTDEELVALKDVYGNHPLHAQADRHWRDNFAGAARKVEAAMVAAGWKVSSRQDNSVSIVVTGKARNLHVDVGIDGIRGTGCTTETEPYLAVATVARIGTP